MKISNYLALAAAGMASVASVASGAVFMFDFESYSVADLNGQDNWIVNDVTADTSAVLAMNNLTWGSSQAGSIGFVAPVIQSSPYVSHVVDTPLVGSVNATFSVLFQVVDSDSGWGAGAEARDEFGFRLEDGSGNNLFSFFLTPFDQDAAPENDTEYNLYSWSTGAGPINPVLRGPIPEPESSQELFAYNLTVAFSPSGINDVAFDADVNGTHFYGTLAGQSAASIKNLGAFWNPLNGPSDPGSNYLVFDGVTLVPEPSSALLALLGVSAGLLRRRRI